jgi:hypothetical protein
MAVEQGSKLFEHCVFAFWETRDLTEKQIEEVRE